MSGYWNEVDKKETREIIRNDCMMTRQRDALDESGGRFAKLTPNKVTGAEPISQVPQQPANSPWSRDVVPPGDAIDKLGYDINEVEAVGPTPPDPEVSHHLPTSVDRGEGSEPLPLAPTTEPGSGSTPTAAPKLFKRRF